MEVFTADSRSTISNRATGALEVFTADSRSTISNRATGALTSFAEIATVTLIVYFPRSDSHESPS
ncbi:hypothetical protein DJ74_04700 [Halorubrum sp. Ea8]|nr:hypothetical protein DJ74_04700 [Halorubrum sp. Ea8]